jgi:hypothetical protein
MQLALKKLGWTCKSSQQKRDFARFHKGTANSTVRVITLSTQNCAQAGSQGPRPLPHMNLNVSVLSA